MPVSVPFLPYPKGCNAEPGMFSQHMQASIDPVFRASRKSEPSSFDTVLRYEAMRIRFTFHRGMRIASLVVGNAIHGKHGGTAKAGGFGTWERVQSGQLSD